jgi:hypothetical protein
MSALYILCTCFTALRPLQTGYIFWFFDGEPVYNINVINLKTNNNLNMTFFWNSLLVWRSSMMMDSNFIWPRFIWDMLSWFLQEVNTYETSMCCLDTRTQKKYKNGIHKDVIPWGETTCFFLQYFYSLVSNVNIGTLSFCEDTCLGNKPNLNNIHCYIILFIILI